ATSRQARKPPEGVADQHGDAKHQDDAEAVRRSITFNDREVMQENERQRDAGLETVAVKQRPTVDLQQGAEAEESENDRPQQPGCQTPPKAQARKYREQKRRHPDKDRIDVGEAGIALLDSPQLPHPVVTEKWVQRDRRREAPQIGRELERIAPSLKGVITVE